MIKLLPMGYTVLDLESGSVGFLLFGLFGFAPGYTFGWLSNGVNFGQRRLATRLEAAGPLSIGLVPVTAYFLWRWRRSVRVLISAGTLATVLLLRFILRVTQDLTASGGSRILYPSGSLCAHSSSRTPWCSPQVTAQEMADTCHEFSITALLFKDTDPVWEDKSSWIWKAHPLLSNNFVHVIKCGRAGNQKHGGAQN